MYLQIPCQGRGEAPAPELVNEFVGDVVQYILQNPGGLIMVHCTHGFNRTGAWWPGGNASVVHLSLPARALLHSSSIVLADDKSKSVQLVTP